MITQASVPPEPLTANANALRIKSLYTAIQNADLTAMAACYDEYACFQDIAFRRRGKGKIMEMWRYVCHGKPEVIESTVISANDRTGSGRWRVKYRFGKTDKKPGLPIDNISALRLSFATASSSSTETSAMLWRGLARLFICQ